MSDEKELAKGVPCPYCGKLVNVKELTTVIEEPVRGVYNRKIIIEKNNQKTL